ncbi:hypothetical protein V8C43DRAFT_299324 [Trichoderma afarasin]
MSSIPCSPKSVIDVDADEHNLQWYLGIAEGSNKQDEASELLAASTDPDSQIAPSTQALVSDKSLSCTFDNCLESFSSVSQLVDHHELEHLQDGCYWCGTCRVEFEQRTGFQRHLEGSNAHKLLVIRCRCRWTFSMLLWIQCGQQPIKCKPHHAATHA